MKLLNQWTIPLLLLLIIAPFTPWIDLNLAQYFYNSESGHFSNSPIYTFIFDWGPLPALMTAVIAGILYLLSFIVRPWKPWRKPALVLMLTMALGAGVIVHAILKDHWGRPRPKQIEQFGGTEAFRPFYEPNLSIKKEPMKSFPCGHCTMGFFFFGSAFIGWRLRIPWLVWTSIILSIVLGLLLGWTRIAQGGHFFSDVLASAVIMWLTAATADWLLYSETNYQ